MPQAPLHRMACSSLGFWVVCRWADASVCSAAQPCMPCVGHSVPTQVRGSSSVYRCIAADTFLMIFVLHLCDFSLMRLGKSGPPFPCLSRSFSWTAKPLEAGQVFPVVQNALLKRLVCICPAAKH